METHWLLEYPHVSCVQASQVYQALAQAALLRQVRGLSQSRRTGSLVLSIDGQNFSSALAAFVRSLLAAALRPSVPVIIELTDFSENLREHEFGCWLRRQDVQLTTCAHCAWRPSPFCGGDARPQSIRQSSTRCLGRWSPSHPFP